MKSDAAGTRALSVPALSKPAELPHDNAGAIQTARYIEDMTIGLRKLAQMHEEAVLAMLLEMAALEAARIAKKGVQVPPPPKPAPLRTRD